MVILRPNSENGYPFGREVWDSWSHVLDCGKGDHAEDFVFWKNVGWFGAR